MKRMYERVLKCGIAVTILSIIAMCFVANGIVGMWLIDLCFYAWMITNGVVMILAILCGREKEEEDEEDEEP